MPTSRREDIEGQLASRPTRLHAMRSSLSQLFLGRSHIDAREPSAEEGPKTPRLALGLENMPSTRFDLPHLHRTPSPSIRSGSTSPSVPGQLPEMPPPVRISTRPITPNTYRQIHSATSVPRAASHRSNPSQVGVDPEEQQLADLADRGRRRRRSKKTKSKGCTQGCMPNIKSRKMRSKIFSVAISGIVLAVVLTIYLALALSKFESQEFHVLLILIILATTIFFCHALISLCMLAIRPEEEDIHRPRIDAMVGPGGYANPARPIRVALARDEEAAGIESVATKSPPPAYGLWRESVRVDPDRIFWQRNEAAQHSRERSMDSESRSAPGVVRPPSYISEDGVDYVIAAQPRSIAPTTDVPLPLHPSERNRGPWGRTENIV